VSAFVATAGGWRASELTRGPWDPGHQHAGPPSALVVREMLRAAAPLGLTHLARLTVNLLRPIPIAELAVAAHFSATVSAEGKEVARCTGLVQRAVPLPLPEGLAGHPLPRAPKPPEDCLPGRFPFHSDERVGYSQLVETRVAAGHMFRGPCAIWFRLRHPLVEGEAPSGAERVAVAADSGNGISAIQLSVTSGSTSTIMKLKMMIPPAIQRPRPRTNARGRYPLPVTEANRSALRESRP